jgi:hypothetical protein
MIQTGFFCDTLTRGAANYCIYSGSSIPSYFGGMLQLGTMPKITTGALTTYGALFGHDASGNFLDNPNLTIVNGVLTMSNHTTSKVLSSYGTVPLQLESTGGNVLINPGGVTAMTVTPTSGLSGHATCWNGTTISYCTSAVATDGTCTCH